MLEANRNNGIVDFFVEVGEFLVEPFDNVFKLDNRKTEVAVNWGLAALVYSLIGALIAKLLRR